VQLEALVAKIEHHRTLYETWGLGAVDPSGRRVAINLFGPPGTGKTMCAEGIAERLGRPIVTVSYAELESKYVGDTPKNIVAAFESARRRGAVLFFDEADSILGRRLTSVTQSADHGVNVSRSVMLLQLNDFEGVVVFATNLAKNYDGAFVRRILGHVEIPLPDAAGRERLAARFFPAPLPRDPEVTAPWLASITEGLSGGEMLQLVIGAATRAVQRTAPDRQVTRDDLTAETRALRAARTAVGIDAPETRVETREATAEEVVALRQRLPETPAATAEAD
jgi:SpoVK/Ycf46/Vps4 family AAA+-type ATPase